MTSHEFSTHKRTLIINIFEDQKPNNAQEFVTIKFKTKSGLIPVKVSVRDLEIVTAKLAEVDEVNQYPAPMYKPTAE